MKPQGNSGKGKMVTRRRLQQEQAESGQGATIKSSTSLSQSTMLSTKSPKLVSKPVSTPLPHVCEFQFEY